MNLDDESLISAYYDDELDPADRLVVEWAVESNPPLAEDLRSLVIAREALSSLGRPAIPRDLSAPVVAKLKAARLRARLHSVSRPVRWVGASAVILSMAASLLFAMVMLHHATHELADPASTIAFEKPPATSDHRTHSIPDTARLEATKYVPDTNLLVAKPTNQAHPRLKPRVKPPGAPDDALDRVVRNQAASLMDQPRVIRALIVTDVIDASDQIQTLIQQDARKSPEFGRITIYQGIVVDPAHPDEAEVFPVVLDEPGSGPFLERLAKRFPRMIVESEINPEFLTQLPEVGQVAIFQGVKAAPLVDPPRELERLITANRGLPPSDQFDSKLVRVPIENDEEFPMVPTPGKGLAGRPGLSSVDAQKPPSDRPSEVNPKARLDNAVTILVWVTRSTH